MAVREVAKLASDEPSAVLALASVPHMLEIIGRKTGARFVAITEPAEGGWTISAARSWPGSGMEVGNRLEAQAAILDGANGREMVVIDDLSGDPRWREHVALLQYGVRSFLSVPIFRPGGTFFGTICLFDRAPRLLDEPVTLGVIGAFARLIGRQLEDGEQPDRLRGELNAEKASSRRREEFIAVLGHDLRSPIASIASGLRVLEREGQSERAMHTIRLMQATIGRMNALIDNLLVLARSRLRQETPFRIEPCAELKAEIQQVIDEIRAATSHEIEFEWDGDCTVRCDRGRMGQLVSNLVTNAVKHGHPTAPVLVECDVKDGRFTLSVENQGRPIPPELQEALFRPFFRGESGGRRAQGFGLGLYIARETARAHGGTLSVDSDQERTRFSLSMPA